MVRRPRHRDVSDPREPGGEVSDFSAILDVGGIAGPPELWEFTFFGRDGEPLGIGPPGTRSSLTSGMPSETSQCRIYRVPLDRVGSVEISPAGSP